MKKIIYITFAAFMFTGCSDFLEREPLELTPENYWNTEEDLRTSLVSLYKNMDEDYTRDTRSIDVYGGGPDEISAGTYQPKNSDGVWNTAYEQIRTINEFYENYNKANVSDEVKNRYLGEANFFKAYYYFQLIRRFGDVPYIQKTLNIDSPELYGPRVDKKIILDDIIQNLLDAENFVPLKKDMAEDVGRVTKGAVQALLGRIALYYGTYYKFHGGNVNYKDYLEIAKNACYRLMTSEQYNLVKDYRTLFLEEGEDSEEHILSIRFTKQTNTDNPRGAGIFAKYRFTPTKHLADAFLCSDGLPIDKSSFKVKYLPMGEEFENRDPRMELTIWRPKTDFLGNPFLPSLSTQTYTGYMFKKYGNEEAYYTKISYIDEIIFRYAEVLLNYAEAVYEKDEYISDEDLDLSINLLRKRFEGYPNKLPNLTNEFVRDHGLDMREEIRRERRVELASEGFRYDDLIRWKTAETELPQTILGIKFDKKEYPDYKKPKLDENGFLIVEDGAKRSFDPEKNYLYPLPLRETSLNEKLGQNPNW